MENDTLAQFLAEISRLQEAATLLGELWNEMGPYDSKFNSSLMAKIRRHFRFDDSE